MSLPIGPSLSSPGAIPPLQLPQFNPAESADGVDFQQLLKEAVQSTSHLQNKANQMIEDKLAGKDVTNVEVLSDVRKADLALRMMLQIRNKLLDAYNEIQQMQL